MLGTPIVVSEMRTCHAKQETSVRRQARAGNCCEITRSRLVRVEETALRKTQRIFVLCDCETLFSNLISHLDSLVNNQNVHLNSGD